MRDLLPRILFFSALFFSFLCIHSCDTSKQTIFPILTAKGSFQGSNYSIQYVDSAGRDIKNQLDSIFRVIENSTYTSDSSTLISRFNNGDSCVEVDNHFLDLFLLSDEVYQITDGAFDPTVKPILDIVSSSNEEYMVDSELSMILTDSLVENVIDFVGWDLLVLGGDILQASKNQSSDDQKETNYVCKEYKKVQITFDAIAQGYALDVVSEYLQYNLGINDFQIELGGKLISEGNKPDKTSWSMIVDDQNLIDAADKSIFSHFELEKYRAVAQIHLKHQQDVELTNINYIDPRTAMVARNQIISAVVFANDCAIADAYTTSFIIMGIEDAVPLIESNPYEGVEAYFVYISDEGSVETYISSGLEDLFLK